ncbi:MAG: elongation factor Ts [Candidatus Omnitrophica bacterium]|nr:elongation factor Ts [Candidatus Omnitrophota bacterium]
MVNEAQLVKELRGKTGAGIMDCRRALQETDWNIEQAIDELRKKGAQIAAKKSGRATNAGQVGTYIHMGGKIGVLVEVNCETDFVARNEKFDQFVKDIAMHIAAAAPLYIDREEVPQDVLEREKAIHLESVQGKPENVVEKIVEGKLEKFYKEICLLEQPYVKDDKQTIREYLTKVIAETGENMTIKRFSRYVLGE